MVNPFVKRELLKHLTPTIGMFYYVNNLNKSSKVFNIEISYVDAHAVPASLNRFDSSYKIFFAFFMEFMTRSNWTSKEHA